MPQGLETYDASGNILTTYTDSLTRVGGSFQTGSADGSITDALIGSVPASRVWWAVRDLTGNSTVYYDSSPPNITISGSTLAWAYPYSGKPNCLITWGVF